MGGDNGILGMKVQSIILVPNGTAYAIDPFIVGIMLILIEVIM